MGDGGGDPATSFGLLRRISGFMIVSVDWGRELRSDLVFARVGTDCSNSSYRYLSMKVERRSIATLVSCMLL